MRGEGDGGAGACVCEWMGFAKDDIENAHGQVLEKGDNFHVYRGLRHQMIALEDTELFEFSTQHFDEDSHRIIKGD